MIRKVKEKDYDQVWEIFQEVIKSEDSYVFKANTPKADLKKHWFAEYMETYVYEEEGEILGSYILKPNQIDLGNHMANASYMVHPEAQGKGIGRKLAEHSLVIAKKAGYLGMQFNIVISTNTAAIKLWKSLGFHILGTCPNAFRHPKLGLVDTHIMYLEL